MIVLDTSAAIELLLALPKATQVQDRLEQAQWQVAAPQLLLVEVLQVLRRRVASGVTELKDAEVARELLHDLSPHYFDHDLLGTRVWQLRDNLTAYDACYVALAELLDVELVTADAKLAAAPGHGARLVLL